MRVRIAENDFTYQIFRSRSDFIYNWSGSKWWLLIQLYVNLIEESKVVQLASTDEGVASQDLTNKWLAMKNRKDTRAIRTQLRPLDRPNVRSETLIFTPFYPGLSNDPRFSNVLRDGEED